MFRNYLLNIKKNIQEKNGIELAHLLSISQENQNNQIIKEIQEQNINFEDDCFKLLPNDWVQIIISHLESLLSISIEQKFQTHSESLNNFLDLARDQTNWLISVLQQMAKDLRKLSIHIYKQNKVNEEFLSKAARVLNKCLEITNNDHSSLETSKKWGALSIILELFRIYFFTNKLHNCGHFINVVEDSSFPNFENFPIYEKVTYKYYVGRMHLLSEEYQLAQEDLNYAFQNCSKKYPKHLKMILFYLVPVNLYFGKIPSDSLLQKYDLGFYIQIVHSFIKGNVNFYDQEIQKYQTLFLKKGIFVIFQSIRILVFRNFMKKFHSIIQNTKIPIEDIQKGLNIIGVDICDNEIKCILSILIYQERIRGYISYTHPFLVLAKKDPFTKF
ncbi:pci domain-containing protein [Anaeramoeba ignava]|uniref:Pci domain-containing protein n=1 Tax=Anaeramoeba ignava TaxID=1746090 RepID=A0A9Q0LTU4_ANAIG|nr:pci domain-containing protein [Anaeramoeba ignava]